MIGNYVSINKSFNAIMDSNNSISTVDAVTDEGAIMGKKIVKVIHKLQMNIKKLPNSSVHAASRSSNVHHSKCVTTLGEGKERLI